jgi:hypothetical protein
MFVGKLPYRPDFNPDKYKAAVPNTDTTVVWGRSGASPFEETFSLSTQSSEEKEVRRKFDVVRIKDPNNEDNHVDVEVLTELETRSKINNKRTTLRMEKPQASDTTEILQRNQERTAT